jgi:hypothetical protein
MPSGRIVWVVGAEPGDPTRPLAAALQAAGGRARLLSDAEAAAWMADVDGSTEPQQVLPSLIVVSARLALAEDAAFLERIGAHQPWSFLPLVVCSDADSDLGCDAAYRGGAASWVVIPSAEDAAEHAARIFARYWLDTTLLPDIAPQARL